MDLAEYKGGAVTVKVPRIEITDAQVTNVIKHQMRRGREREERQPWKYTLTDKQPKKRHAYGREQRGVEGGVDSWL